MEATFISIHDVSPDARILYSSDSVVDILGYTPDELVNRSAWDFFPAEEVPFAQAFHQKGVSTDKAAVLAYCNVKGKNGDWICCECIFSIVYDVMIVCTSVYRVTPSSQRRSQEAPIVRRIFSSSPKDPRYHMLAHISTKFTQPVKQPQIHEPRAALFLNRFTRSLSIMYATSAIEEITGISAEAMRGLSFYYCIAENCHADAVKCLENAKANDSIAYLRFWFTDPRERDRHPSDDDESDEDMMGDMSEHDTDGVNQASGASTEESRSPSKSHDVGDKMEVDNARDSSNDSATPADTHEGIFGQAREPESSRSSVTRSDGRSNYVEPIELEAVISCTSDGLVVCLRKAKATIPRAGETASSPTRSEPIFASPWATPPIMPSSEHRNASSPSSSTVTDPQATASSVASDGHDFMAAIREQAVFAWAVAGINGTLGSFASGKPKGDSLPPDGLPIWSNDPRHADCLEGSSNGSGIFASPSPPESSLSPRLFGDPGLDRKGGSAEKKNSPPRENKGGSE